jgi:tetratricopeptide (TPR) repeat protein
MLLALMAWHQTGVYRDSGTLWKATLRSYPNCLAAHNFLANWLMGQGRWDEALDHCRQALAILPNDTEARNNLSRVFLRQGKLDEAIAEALQSRLFAEGRFRRRRQRAPGSNSDQSRHA